MQSQKWHNDLCSFLRQMIQDHNNPSLCPDQECWRSWSWMVLWRFTRPSRTNIQKRCLFHYRRLECKIRKSRDTWSNRQICPWHTKQSRSKANEFCQENALVIANTLFQQHEKTLHMDITRWSIPKSNWLYSLQPKMEKLYTVSKNKTVRWLYEDVNSF